MSVYTKPNSPFWYFDFRWGGRRFYRPMDGIDGRPRVPKESPRRAAVEAEARFKVAISQPRNGRARITLHDAAARYWLEEAQHYKDHAGEHGNIGVLERLLGKNTFIDEIDGAVVAGLVAKRRTEKARYKEKRVAPRTVNGAVECLARIFKRVAGWKMRLPEDVPTWSAYKLKVPQERTRTLTGDEDDALFKAIDDVRPDFRDFIEFALLTGKRLAEVYMLEKAKVDRRAMTARAVQKGGKEIVIALTAASLAIIERNWMHHPTRVFTYINQANKVYVQKGVTVAVRKKQRRPFTQNGWRKPWKAILKKSGVTDFRFHDLRHTQATRILAATGNLKAVQVALSHASIASTARYAHTTTDQNRGALEAAEALRVPHKSPTRKI